MNVRKIRRFRLAIVAALLGVLALGLAGCSSPEPIELTANTVVIDVRSPEEFASGHLDGALNINWEGEFTEVIGQLPLDGEYLLYCRSGNRAGQAKAFMEAAGFSNVTNLGGLQDAANATGITIVN